MSKWFYKISKDSLVIASILIFIIFGMTVLPDQSAKAEIYSADTGTPDLSLFYSPADLIRMAESYGPEGRQAYVYARFTFDLVFPLVYAFFLITSTSWLLERLIPAENPWRKLNLIPLIGMLFDLLENGSAAWVMRAYPNQANIAAITASIFTPLKWLFVIASFIILGITAFMTFRKSLNKI